MPWPSCTMQRIRYRAREMRYRIGDFSLPGTWPLGNSSHYPLFKSSRRSLRYRPWRTWAELGSWNKGTKAVTEILQGDGTQYSCSPSPLQIEPRTSITALAWSIAARKTHVASRGVIECFCQDTRQVYADLDYRLTVTYTGTPWIADEFRYK